MQRLEQFIASYSNPVFPLYIYGLGASIFFIGFVWFFYLLIKRPAIIDVYTPIGYMILASLFYLTRPYGGFGNVQAKLFLGLITLWCMFRGIQLLLQMMSENGLKPKDDFFTKNFKHAIPRHLAVFGYHSMYMVFHSLLALSFLGLASNEKYFGVYFYVGIALATVAIVVSTVLDLRWTIRSADSLSQQSKAGEKDNHASVIGGEMTASKVSRTSSEKKASPFLEVLIWTGFALMSFESFAGYIVFLAPATALLVSLLKPIFDKQRPASTPS